jgi:hypothetical protein
VTLPAYNKLKTEYDKAIKALYARDRTWYYTAFPTTRPASDAVTVPSPTPNRPYPPTKYDFWHYSKTLTTDSKRANPTDFRGGWGYTTAGTMTGYITGKSMGLIGPDAISSTAGSNGFPRDWTR